MSECTTTSGASPKFSSAPRYCRTLSMLRACTAPCSLALRFSTIVSDIVKPNQVRKFSKKTFNGPPCTTSRRPAHWPRVRAARELRHGAHLLGRRVRLPEAANRQGVWRTEGAAARGPISRSPSHARPARASSRSSALFATSAPSWGCSRWRRSRPPLRVRAPCANSHAGPMPEEPSDPDTWQPPPPRAKYPLRVLGSDWQACLQLASSRTSRRQGYVCRHTLTYSFRRPARGPGRPSAPCARCSGCGEGLVSSFWLARFVECLFTVSAGLCCQGCAHPHAGHAGRRGPAQRRNQGCQGRRAQEGGVA